MEVCRKRILQHVTWNILRASIKEFRVDFPFFKGARDFVIFRSIVDSNVRVSDDRKCRLYTADRADFWDLNRTAIDQL